MIRRLVVAAVIGFLVFLLFLFIAILCKGSGVPIIVDIGSFCNQWAVAIGLAAAILSFFTGWDPFTGLTNRNP